MNSARNLVLLLVFALRAGADIRLDSETLQAIEAAQRALSSDADSQAKRLALASLYLKTGQNRSAIELLSPWLKTHPNAPQALRLLATAYLRDDNYTKAKDAAEQALRAGHRDAITVEILAMAQLGLQETVAAERLFLEAQRLDPASVEAYLQLGLLYTKQRRNLPDAIRLLQKARALQPDLAGTSAALGSAWLESGNAREAAAALETAVKLDPESAESYYLLASAYRALHEEDKAAIPLAEFNTRKRAAADMRAREMRGRADYEEGVNLLSNTERLDEAYAALTRSVKELPDFDAAYYRMAQIAYLKGDSKSALGSIHEALRLNPLEPEYYYVLARCLEDSDPRAAREAVEKAIAFRPGVQDFEELLRELKSKP